LALGQTILEEEVHRQAQMSAPTRVRRFLSRFMVVPAGSDRDRGCGSGRGRGHAGGAHDVCRDRAWARR
jgi:hypothetical protein